MKKIPHIFLILTVLGCSTRSQKVVVSNQHDFRVSYKLVRIEKAAIEEVKNQLPFIKEPDGRYVPSQLLDTDQDGLWDQLIFQVSVEAQSNTEYFLEWVSKNEYPSYDRQTQVYLGYSEMRDDHFVSVNQSARDKNHVPQKAPYTYQLEGPGWENNLVAFRSYFDTRNGKDIFGKTTEEMVAHKIGTGENYHTLQEWGMDVLKVGQSLGAGALAILKNDTLIRLGETASAEFVKVHEGPVLSSFRLVYKGWDVKGSEYELQENITIQANKRWYESTVSILPAERNQPDTMVIGIVNLKGAMVQSIDQDDFQTLYTHGIQSENEDALGMALLVEEKYYLNAAKAPVVGKGITSSELVYVKPSNGSFAYYFYAGWEMENPRFKQMDGFRESLEITMSQLSADLIVQVQ